MSKKLTTIRVDIETILSTDVNPMFDYEVVCKRLCIKYDIPREKWRTFYGRVQYHIRAMENEHKLFVYRVTNGGTVFMLKSQALKYATGQTVEEIPF